MRLASIILLLLSIFNTNISRAQLLADFKADTLKGCAPLIVNFTDQSTGNITLRKWVFGNGNSKTGNDLNVIATYPNPGVYTVTLTVSNDLNSHTFSRTIEVLNKPTADFNSNSELKGCTGLEIQFNDNSIGNAGIKQWSWNFGDGSGSNQQNPGHQYNLQSNYPVSLQILDSNGCSSSKLINDFVKVSDKPKIDFYSSITSACIAPLNASFNNVSSGNGILTYLWKFGDGRTSSEQGSPINCNYPIPGNFDVTLIAKDGNNCADTLTKESYIQIGNITASFEIIKNQICKGDSFYVNNTTGGASQYIWKFGDGTSSTQFKPDKIFDSAGFKTITLIAKRGTACIDSIQKTIQVNEIVGNFSTDKNYGCELPFEVQYSDNTQGVVWRKWNLGNRGTTNLPDPLINFTEGGVFSDTLYVKDTYGCSDTVIKPNNINLALLHSEFTIDRQRGCAPLKVRFTNSSSPVDSIVSYSWNFNDGTTSSQIHPTHFFNLDTSYNVTLTIMNSHNCKAQSDTFVWAGSKPKADFVATSTSICGGETEEQFKDLSTGKVNEWLWDFGDSSTFSSIQNPKHAFIDTGMMSVGLKAGFNGCFDEVVKPNILRVKGPIASFSPILDCNKTYGRTFNGKIIDATRFRWDFGDGQSDSLNRVIVHQYDTLGNFDVTLNAYNDNTGCKDLLNTKTIKIRDLKVSSKISLREGCAPLKVTMDTINIVTTDSIKKFEWNYGDGSSKADSVSKQTHSYSKPGKFPLKLTVNDANGCPAFKIDTIKVHKPIAGFSSDKPLVGCSPMDVKFLDTTRIDLPIKSWKWYWGDGTSPGTIQNPNHIFSVSQSNKTLSFKVKLVVMDIMGCADSTSKTYKISSLKSDFLISGTGEICTNVPVAYIPIAPAYYNFKWYFGDGDSSDLHHPNHSYTTPGSYKVSLLVSNGTCNLKKEVANCIKVQQKPKPDFIVSDAIIGSDSVKNIPSGPFVSGCYPVTINLKDRSIGSSINSWKWSLGLPGAISNSSEPVQSYVKPGNYDLSLIVSTTFGCSDTLLRKNFIDVRGPEGEFSTNSSVVCKDTPVNFVLTDTANAFYYTWDFGDGEIDSIVSPVHSFDSPGNKNVFLIMRNKDKTCLQIRNKTLSVPDIHASFIASDSIGCVPFEVNFSDKSSANTFSRKWDFTSGNSTEKDPKHSFQIPGLFNINLIASDVNGCKDIVSKQVLVNPVPDLIVKGGKKICPGDTAELLVLASGGQNYNYKWNSGNISDQTINNPKVYPLESTIYTVKVTDNNFCTAEKSTTVLVQQAPVIKNMDTMVVIGEIAKINYAAGEGFKYNWGSVENFSCKTCSDPEILALESNYYKVNISDSLGCYNEDAIFRLHVKKEYTLDLPEAFTPNGDGVNDEVFVRGWGIKELREFKVINRWGQVIFNTNNLHTGWDGTFEGKLQNIDTYSYVVSVQTYENKIIEKKGMITLLR